jgi:hypothetical protein
MRQLLKSLPNPNLLRAYEGLWLSVVLTLIASRFKNLRLSLSYWKQQWQQAGSITNTPIPQVDWETVVEILAAFTILAGFILLVFFIFILAANSNPEYNT